MTDTPDRQVASIAKNARERVVIALRTYKSVRSADLRVYALNTDGELVATAKGISIKPAQLPAVIAGMQEVLAAAIEEGLVDGQ